MSDKKHAKPRVVANNLIAEHGKAAFNQLIEMFCAGESGTKIGEMFGVSRQRVNQWKAALGIEHISFELHDEIKDLAPRSKTVARRTLV